VTQVNLEAAFDALFSGLPEFHVKYPKLGSAVVEAQIIGQGVQATVLFFDDVLATTAVRMDGFVLFGQPVRVRRPSGYTIPSGGELQPLSVAPLRSMGFIPRIENRSLTSHRELHIDNLPGGEQKVRDALVELVSCISSALPEYRPELGNPVWKATMAPSKLGHACFVEFQSEALAVASMPSLYHAVLHDAPLAVSRPRKYWQHMRTQAECFTAATAWAA